MPTEPSTIVFTVPGDPVSKLRPREHYHTPRKTTRFEALVAVAFLAENRGRFTTLRPATRVTVMLHFRTRRHPDPNNVLSAILDGLTGCAYQNDNRIACAVEFKERMTPPCSLVTVS